MALHNLGFSAIAVLGASPKRLKSWFKAVRQQRTLLAVGDNDPAGAQLVRLVGSGFQSPLDLDEMSQKEVLTLLAEHGIMNA